MCFFLLGKMSSDLHILKLRLSFFMCSECLPTESAGCVKQRFRCRNFNWRCFCFLRNSYWRFLYSEGIQVLQLNSGRHLFISLVFSNKNFVDGKCMNIRVKSHKNRIKYRFIFSNKIFNNRVRNRLNCTAGI